MYKLHYCHGRYLLIGRNFIVILEGEIGVEYMSWFKEDAFFAYTHSIVHCF